MDGRFVITMPSFPRPFDEKDVLRRLRAADEAAFNELMERYKRPLAKSMLRILKSREDTEEALQELFVRVWMNRTAIDPERPIKAYLFRIAENLVYDLLRKAAREKRLVAEYFTHLSEAYLHVEEQLFDEETKTILRDAIAQLPEQRRRVFELCKVEGKSYEEVSRQLSISIATVNSHITNANAFLREYFRSRPDLASAVLAGLLLMGI